MILFIWQNLFFHYLERILELLSFLLILFENKFIFPLLTDLLSTFWRGMRWNYKTAISRLIRRSASSSMLVTIRCIYTFVVVLMVAAVVVDLVFGELHVWLGHFWDILFFNALKISNHFTFQILLNQIHWFILLIFDHILKNRLGL